MLRVYLSIPWQLLWEEIIWMPNWPLSSVHYRRPVNLWKLHGLIVRSNGNLYRCHTWAPPVHPFGTNQWNNNSFADSETYTTALVCALAGVVCVILCHLIFGHSVWRSRTQISAQNFTRTQSSGAYLAAAAAKAAKADSACTTVDHPNGEWACVENWFIMPQHL